MRLPAALLILSTLHACAQTIGSTSGDAGARDGVVPVDAGALCSAAQCICGRGEACNYGVCNEARPVLQWVRTFRSSYGATLGVAVSDDGSVAAGGYVRGVANLGDVAFDTGSATDAVVVRYDAVGATRWSRRFAGDFAQVRSVALDARGVWVNGTFGAYASVAGRTFRSTREPDSFVARLDPGGAVTDAWQLSGGSDEQAVAVVTHGNGDAVTAGYYNGEGQLGTTPLRPIGSPAGFAASLSPGGAVAWTRTFGTANTTLRGVTRTPNGFAVVGIFTGTLDLGTRLTSAGRFDTFVASITDAGDMQWATSYGGAGDDFAEGIASDVRGNVYVVSGSTRGLTVGDVTRDGAAGLLVAFDGGGRVRWSRGLGALESGNMRAVAVDAAGNPVVAATFREPTVPEGFDAFHSLGETDVFWVLYDRDARALAGRSFGGIGSETLTAVAAGPCGGFVLAGTFEGTANLGGPIVTAARVDGFVAVWR
jgi:hypothetical protein